MVAENKKPLRLFYCYTRKDKNLRDELDTYLNSLKYQTLISTWYDGEISPGEEWTKEIANQLQTAHIILLLITPHFIASDYCDGVSFQRALQRHQAGDIRIIPIILQHASWQSTPLSSLQALPTDARPVAQWPDRDEAFWNITHGIRKTIIEFHERSRVAQEWLDKAHDLDNLKRYEEAIACYDQALLLDPNDLSAYHSKSTDLASLKRYDEAIAVHNQILFLDPGDISAYYRKGHALDNLKRYEEAVTTYDQILLLDPGDILAYHRKGHALDNLKRYEEAITVYDQILLLDPRDTFTYLAKGHALANLNRYEEAITVYDQILLLDSDILAYLAKGHALTTLERYEEVIAVYDQALLLDPNNAQTYHNKSTALYKLKCYEEALSASEHAIQLDPNNAQVYHNKGIILRKLRRSKEAQYCEEKARQLGYNGQGRGAVEVLARQAIKHMNDTRVKLIYKARDLKKVSIGWKHK